MFKSSNCLELRDFENLDHPWRTTKCNSIKANIDCVNDLFLNFWSDIGRFKLIFFFQMILILRFTLLILASSLYIWLSVSSSSNAIGLSEILFIIYNILLISNFYFIDRFEIRMHFFNKLFWDLLNHIKCQFFFLIRVDKINFSD